MKPVFPYDHAARTQIRETRSTILEHLAESPDDFKALVLADAIGEIDPDRDPALAAHRMRFRATRDADWRLRAKQLGLDRLLFQIVNGLMQARIGKDAIPALESYANDICEADPSGIIGAESIPDALVSDPRATIAYHPSGHLARAAVMIDDMHNGELVLAERPGSGSFTIVEKRGGYGTMIREDYRDGGVVVTLNTPWHDGEESTISRPWTRWCEENLSELARLTGVRAKARAGGRNRSR